MSGKIPVLELLAEMHLLSQIAGFFKLEYLLNYMRYQLDVLFADTHPLRLQADHSIIAYSLASSGIVVGVARHSQACPKCAEITNF